MRVKSPENMSSDISPFYTRGIIRCILQIDMRAFQFVKGIGRVGIHQWDIKILWGLSGNCCAFPGCSRELITTEPEVSVLAEMAHIIAHRPDGPRGTSTLSLSERDSYENLILLCPTHHTLIDKDSSTWTSDKLLEMKLNQE